MKKKFKKALRSPGKAAALSMMAILLVCAVPAIMAVTDESASYDVDNPIEYDESALIHSYNNYVDGTWTSAIVGSNMHLYMPSENGGMYLIDSKQTESAVTEFQMYVGTSTVHSAIDGAKHVVITTSHDLTRVQYRVNYDANQSALFNFENTSPGVWEYSFSSAESLLLDGYSLLSESLKLKFAAGAFPADGLVEFGIDFYDSPIPIYYATTVAMIFGILLIVCAIFASPWVGFREIRNAGKKAKKYVGGK